MYDKCKWCQISVRRRQLPWNYRRDSWVTFSVFVYLAFYWPFCVIPWESIVWIAWQFFGCLWECVNDIHIIFIIAYTLLNSVKVLHCWVLNIPLLRSKKSKVQIIFQSLRLLLRDVTLFAMHKLTLHIGAFLAQTVEVGELSPVIGICFFNWSTRMCVPWKLTWWGGALAVVVSRWQGTLGVFVGIIVFRQNTWRITSVTKWREHMQILWIFRHQHERYKVPCSSRQKGP